ncbi:helix-turn-helix transcriptional regulator [Gordonia sp. CPCC 206044]|uniref:ArsR/SmtB family transcription factor n=1 Tax=Gordonia sp. CPCC 206044 TaxID=3140793 RepID=UPI003AF352E9
MGSDPSLGRGDPDIARTASAFADPRRVRVLMALIDGRALPAGRLAEEAGVAASTISNHLATLLEHGLVIVEQQGRHRYYRLASVEVERVLEALAPLAPRMPITSLRQHTKAAALRNARTCYRHLAGHLGVHVFGQMIRAEWVTGGDGRHDPTIAGDRLSAPGTGAQYRLTDRGAEALSCWGIPVRVLDRERPLRYCVDWTEEAHHLAGPLGSAVTDRFFELGWIMRGNIPRSIRLTPSGESEIAAIHPDVDDGMGSDGQRESSEPMSSEDRSFGGVDGPRPNSPTPNKSIP